MAGFVTHLEAAIDPVAAYVDDNIFATCGEFGVALKLPSETVEHLLSDQDAQLLKYSTHGRIKKYSVVIPVKLLVDRENLGPLVDQSVQYVCK